MSPRIAPSPTRVADAVAWLRERLASDADLRSDSRTIRPGDAFLAYAVEGADNRPHVADAARRGAQAVLWQPEGASTSALAAGVPVLDVPSLDTLAGPLASAWYGDPSQAMLTVGVTGTNGKTSCCQWIAQALTAWRTKCAVVGTLGVGLPGQMTLTGLQRLPKSKLRP